MNHPLVRALGGHDKWEKRTTAMKISVELIFLGLAAVSSTANAMNVSEDFEFC